MTARRVTAAALLVLSGLAAAAVAGWRVTSPGPDPSTTLPATVHSAAPVQPASSKPIAARNRSVPVRLVIPAIGVNAPVMAVGLQGGSAGVPPLGARNLVAWFDRTVTPGEAGPSLIDGHVDSAATGPSVFYNLKNLRPGDKVLVTRQDKSTVTFTVTWVQVVPKAAFPWSTVLAPAAGPELRLVTCGGPFSYATGHYEDNVIVYATSKGKEQ